MKKKYLSIITSVLSLVAAVTFVILAILFAVRLSQGKEYVPQVPDSFWLNEVIQRIKKAGFNVFFSIMGVITSLVFAVYRTALAYFHFKVFKGDDEFYKERKKEIIFFSVLSAVVAVVACYLWANKTLLPLSFRPLCVILALTYIAISLLPIAELVTVSLLNGKKTATEKEVKILDKDDIINELDILADETAEKLHETENAQKTDEIE